MIFGARKYTQIFLKHLSDVQFHNPYFLQNHIDSFFYFAKKIHNYFIKHEHDAKDFIKLRL